MSDMSGHTPEQPVEPSLAESPRLSVDVGEHTFVLTWHDTIYRRFRQGDGEFDHIAHRTDDGRTLFFRAPEKTVAMLREWEFPESIHPLVDDTTMAWYVDCILSQEIEQGWGQAEGG